MNKKRYQVRDKKMAQLWESLQLNQRQLGRLFDITSERVRQILHQELDEATFCQVKAIRSQLARERNEEEHLIRQNERYRTDRSYRAGKRKAALNRYHRLKVCDLIWKKEKCGLQPQNG